MSEWLNEDNGKCVFSTRNILTTSFADEYLSTPLVLFPIGAIGSLSSSPFSLFSLSGIVNDSHPQSQEKSLHYLPMLMIPQNHIMIMPGYLTSRPLAHLMRMQPPLFVCWPILRDATTIDFRSLTHHQSGYGENVNSITSGHSSHFITILCRCGRFVWHINNF